jgi:putative zinc finger/helix-turn-helix YgiT family protein
MRCYNCGRKMKEKKGRYHFIESGLPNIYLDGVTIHYCSCGEESAAIPCLDKLLERIAHVIVEKSPLLTGTEVRFLRKSLGLKSVELAEMLDVSKVTVSRWENDKARINKSYDNMIRALIQSKDFKTVLQGIRRKDKKQIAKSHRYTLDAGELACLQA